MNGGDKPPPHAPGPCRKPAGEQPAGSPPADGASNQPGASIQPAAGGSAAISYGAYARAIVTERARIGKYLDPTLFSDPAFDILLDLLASEEEGRKVSMSSCAYAARVARTTGLRWICLLESKGLVERVADAEDQRTTLVRLTDAARTSLIRYLQQVVEPSITR
jgi:DNA-binding MarR family transcriptional regulator